MRPPRNKWGDSETERGTLFFAQMMRELSGPGTFESFRAYTLDTLARLREALQLVRDVENETIARASIAPLFEELAWSLSKDPVASKLLASEIENLHELTKRFARESLPLRTAAAFIAMLGKRLEPHYKAHIEAIISKSHTDPKRRVATRHACGFYCSYLINVGYSKNHIAAAVDRLFFARSKPVGSVRRFFRLFDAKVRSFRVWVGVSDEFGRFLRSLEYNIFDRATVDAAVLQSIKEAGGSDEFELFLETFADAHDPFGALQEVNQELNAVRSITYLDLTGMVCRWDAIMHISRIRSEPQAPLVVFRGAALSKPNAVLARKQGNTKTSGKRVKRIKRYTELVVTSFSPASRERMLSSLNTAALAQTSSNPENQLISLWSAFEVLVSEPMPGTARIVHYVDVLVPCIVSRHLRRQIIAVYNELVVSYRAGLNRILQKVPDFIDAQTKLAGALALAEHEPLRREMVALLLSNPLALHRLWKISRDLASPKTVLAALDGHYERVEWQVQRIYRARNGLVHAGTVPAYLEALILNLSEYYRAATTTIIRRASQEKELSTVDQIVAEVGFDYAAFRRRFEKSKSEEALSIADVKMLFT